jgi:hypothetical protein
VFSYVDNYLSESKHLNLGSNDFLTVYHISVNLCQAMSTNHLSISTVLEGFSPLVIESKMDA